MQDNFNMSNFLNYWINHYISTDVGKQLIQDSFADYPELLQFANTRADLHNKIKLSLGDEGGGIMSSPPNKKPMDSHQPNPMKQLAENTTEMPPDHVITTGIRG